MFFCQVLNCIFLLFINHFYQPSQIIYMIFICSFLGLWKVCEKYRKLMSELAQVSTSTLMPGILKDHAANCYPVEYGLQHVLDWMAKPVHMYLMLLSTMNF